jgi:hypothetical protein
MGLNRVSPHHNAFRDEAAIREMICATDLFFRLVQMFSRRQVFEILEVLGPQRFRNHVRLAEPFAEINEFASFRAKRAK